MSTQFVRDNTILFSRDQSNEHVVTLDIENGRFHSLNETASCIWEMLEHPLPEPLLVERLVDNYQVEKTVCEEAVQCILADFLRAKLIVQLE